MSCFRNALALAGRALMCGAAALMMSLSISASALASPEKLIAFTGYLPPFSIDRDHKGIAVELMEMVAREAGIELEFRYAPWKRAQLLAENTPGSLLFTVAYSTERSKKFQYIAPLLYTESAFVTLDQPVDTFESAIEEGKLVAVHLGSQRSLILKRAGVTNLTEITSAEQMSTMLQTGRIDAWYTTSLRAQYMFRQQGYDPERLVIGAPVSHGIQWLASNKDLAPALRARLAAAVSNVWRHPNYWKIVDRYGR
ncbi:substrate-binding periplasmic protein [Roseibium sp.]|uniref:substrate-binding periplasmic protein n=1 Tax=Roseibium sp. TaxID=1936156 RepID=UPI003D0D2DE9